MAYETEKIEYADTTWYIDDVTKSIKGYCNGYQAIKQQVKIIINTERFAYPIFSNNFGIQTKDLLGGTNDFIESMIKKRLKDGLTDRRIIDLSNFEFNGIKDDTGITGSVEVDTVYGKVREEYGF